MQDTVDMIIMLITVTIIMHILKIYVGRILPPIPSGTTNIMPVSNNNNNSTSLEESTVIQRIELAFILVVVHAMIGMF